MTTVNSATDLFQTKLALLQLVDETGSVTNACRVMGYSRGSYYRIRARFLARGAEGLRETGRRDFVPSNRLRDDVEAVIVELSCQHPQWGRRRLVAALAERGISLSPSGVRCVWKRHGLLTARHRAHGLRTDMTSGAEMLGAHLVPDTEPAGVAFYSLGSAAELPT